MLSEEWQQNVASSCSHQAMIVGQQWMIIAHEYGRPSAVYRPTLSIDGDQWCALYGADLQNGVAGFGDSPSKAMDAFDIAWRCSLSEGSVDG